MKPFSALKFFACNKKKALLTFIVLILTVCAVSLISVLINSITQCCTDVYFKMFEHFSFVTTSDEVSPLPQSTIDKLNGCSDIDTKMTIDYQENTYMTLPIGGSVNIPIFVASEDTQKVMLDKTKDTVKTGRMPKYGTNEIAVHWRVMNNNKWKIGQYVGSKVNDEERLNGKYKIVGVLDGPSVIGYAGSSYTLDQYKKAGFVNNGKAYAYVVFPKEGKLSAVNNLLGTFDKKTISATTYDSLKKEIDKELSGISSTLTAIIIVVVGILSISIGALMYLIYVQRSDEFGILAAMGYRRSFTMKLIFKEIFSLNIIGWIFGMLCAFGFISLLNQLIYLPKGTPLNFFNGSTVYNTLIIPIMVGLFSSLPVAIKLKKQDAITIIERRD